MTTRTGEGMRWGDHSRGEGRSRVLQGRAAQARRQAGELGHSGPWDYPCCLPCWPWEKWVPCKQVRPHLCPPSIAPLFDGHRWGLEGGQDDVVG